MRFNLGTIWLSLLTKAQANSSLKEFPSFLGNDEDNVDDIRKIPSQYKPITSMLDVVVLHALLKAKGAPQKFCPGSGVTTPALLQCMIAATVEELLNRGIEPPLFLAANVQGGDEYNERMFELYKDRIFYI